MRWMLVLLCGLGFAYASPLVAPALHAGDTVGLIASGFRANHDEDIVFAEERLQALGLKVLLSPHVYDRDGYYAGTDQVRANDINAMFANPKVKGIFQVRGGWGSAKLLSLIDYEQIKHHPKVIIGFSDITTLLLAIQAKTGLVTFHGPVASYPMARDDGDLHAGTII